MYGMQPQTNVDLQFVKFIQILIIFFSFTLSIRPILVAFVHTMLKIVLNFSYDDLGSKVSVNLIGPFHHYDSNASGDFISINVHSNTFNMTNQTVYYGINETGTDVLPVSFDILSNFTGSAINFSIGIESFAERPFKFQLFVDPRSMNYETGIISAAVILVFLNILIATEVGKKARNSLCHILHISKYPPCSIAGGSSYGSCNIHSLHINWHFNDAP